MAVALKDMYKAMELTGIVEVDAESGETTTPGGKVVGAPVDGVSAPIELKEQGGGYVAIDTSTDGGIVGSPTTFHTFNHTVGSGAGRLLVSNDSRASRVSL